MLASDTLRQVQPYWDLALRHNRESHRRFFLKLCSLGLGGWRRRIRGKVGFFFVSKTSGDQRMVVDARYIDISADVSVNGTKVGEASVDPMVYSIMVGKRF
jgi:hypothetical protein